MDGLGIDRRRLGTGLLAFGLVGVVLAGLVGAGLIGGAIAARNLDDRLSASQAQLVLTLERVTGTVDRVASTTGNGSQTLLTTSETVRSAGAVLGRLAGISDELSTSLDIAILGQRPLAGAAARFGELAGDVRAVQADTDRLATRLGANAVDVSALATDITRLNVQLETMTARVKGFDQAGEIIGLLVAGILLVGLLAAWLAVAAAICAWVGWRLRRGPVDEAGPDPSPAGEVAGA
ncbi:MAG: hypothetical protein AB1627_05985 [Chloroflexota bacterium]